MLVASHAQLCRRLPKIPMHHPYVVLQPLLPRSKPWKSISTDFSMDFPPSNDFDTIREQLHSDDLVMGVLAHIG